MKRLNYGKAYFLWLTCLTIVACTDSTQEQGSINSQTANVKLPDIPFTNVGKEYGINFKHESGEEGERYIPSTFGSGIAFFDYNNDGYPDLLAVSGKSLESQSSDSTIALFENKGGTEFLSVTEKTLLHENFNYNIGIAIGDVNGDGFLDIFVAGLHQNSLYMNVEGRHFENVTTLMGLESSEMSSDAAFFDADQDGDLDLIVGNYVEWSKDIDNSYDDSLATLEKAYSHPNSFNPLSVKLYINEYPKPFKDVSKVSGIAENEIGQTIKGKALAVQPMFINDDQLVDVFVANDNWRNFAFINLGNGMFTEQAEYLGLAYGFSGAVTAAMGVDFGWFGPEKKLHIATGNFSADMTSIYRKESADFYSDVSPLIGIGAPSRNSLTWGVMFADFDLDGREDFLQVNSHVQIDINAAQSSQTYKQSPQLFWNCGEACARQFQLLNAKAIKDLSEKLPARSLAAADIDLDGDLDVAIGAIDSPTLLFRNDQDTGNNWLKVSLSQDLNNSHAIGAIVEVYNEQISLKQALFPVTSYLSHSDQTLIFGLGKSAEDVTVKVVWPNGDIFTREDISINQTLHIKK